MVATKLSEVAGKGWGWYSTPSSDSADVPDGYSQSQFPPSSGISSAASPCSAVAAAAPIVPSALPTTARNLATSVEAGPSSFSSSDSYYQRAKVSLHHAAMSTYAGLADAASYLYYDNDNGNGNGSGNGSGNNHRHPSGDDTDGGALRRTAARRNPALSEDHSTSTMSSSAAHPQGRSRRLTLMGMVKDPASIVPMPASLLTMIHNPYVGIRGGGPNRANPPHQSMEALRSLLHVAPWEGGEQEEPPGTVATAAGAGAHGPSARSFRFFDVDSSRRDPPPPPPATKPGLRWPSVFPSVAPDPARERRDTAAPSSGHPRQAPYPHPASPEEMASQLAEGILRAYRDLALDEAVELHLALRYWTNRWERPLMSWLEAGPMVWWSSQEGYNHQLVGEKVSQIQAVLVRRLSAIGGLQQHLLRAGWQRGVAQWGFLGGGGEWAAVAGTDGRMKKSDTLALRPSPHRGPASSSDAEVEPYGLGSDPAVTTPRPPTSTAIASDLHAPLPRRKLRSGASRRSQQHNQLYYTNLFVKRKDGGRISKDDPALAQWSVDAMALVRSHMHRASTGQIALPYAENWSEGVGGGGIHVDPASSANSLPMEVPAALPAWASAVGRAPPRRASYSSFIEDDLVSTDDDYDEGCPNYAGDESESDEFGNGVEMQNKPLPNPRSHHRFRRPVSNRVEGQMQQRVTISDLNLMVCEVSGLLDVMQDVVDHQRARRLDQLKPPSWYRQYWFATAFAAPSVAYVVFRLAIKRDGWHLLKHASDTILNFFQEHVVRPCFAMYHELTKGTESISDRAARDTAIITLKQMILSWLDETFPEMSESQKWEVADKMDISLIEAMKERNMKTIYELNSVIRMSFIEAQFIKKEMMNALVALDDMQASTNFNMNLAAITPFVLLMWTTKRVFSFLFYTTFKWGKSREETYLSIFRSLTEMERLLIMRNNPPAAPMRHAENHETSSHGTAAVGDSVLDSDDLGMLMLHIHEIRTILWEERRRFSNNVLRSVSEDLAELSGERGALSVRQQLLIVERMNRSYTFMKPTSSSLYATG